MPTTDPLHDAAALIERIAGFITYEEALAEAHGDPDRATEIREDYMQDIEDDFSDLILRARRINLALQAERIDATLRARTPAKD